MEPIYLDYNATTPIDPMVADAIRPYLEHYFGNPSSTHAYGVQSKNAVERARKQVALLLNASSDEIVFTSGGTESNNFAIKGVAFANRHKGNHIITSGIEHPAVTEVCHWLEGEGFTITWLPVDETGLIDPVDLERAITGQTILITIMHANNETGTIQRIEEIGRMARARGILFHTDAAQSVGKIPVDVQKLGVDLLSVAGHKLYAPKGVGALYIRRGVNLAKLIHGADHEANRRAGTENVPEIVGLGAAAEIIKNYELRITDQDPAGSNMIGSEAVLAGAGCEHLRDMLYEGILGSIPEVRLNGHPTLRLPNTLSLGFPGVEANMLLGEMKGIAASAGAACHADHHDISGVLTAMHVPLEYALGTIRFSLGRMTTREEVERAVILIVEAYRSLKGNPGASTFIKPAQEMIQTAPDNDLTKIRENINVINTHSQLFSSDNNQVSAPPGVTSIFDIQKPAFHLTEYTHALGCACKIRPQLLERILKSLPGKNNPAILVGYETSDDAAVYRIDENLAIVQTVDFIPPVVDDPYMYGAIAAANALSDIYAMGGKPLFALSIVGFPDRKLPMEVLQQILKGANEKITEAGIQVVGGHSVEDSEPKFGFVVTGLINPGKIWRNSTSKPGDSLILTKPIGTGIITTAVKHGLASDAAVERVMSTMAELNRVPAEIMAGFEINACTDVTGFGLLGHLKEMVCGAGLHADLNAAEIPVLDDVWAYAAAGSIPGGTRNNLDYVAEIVHWKHETPELLKFILADAQTSGGLLISLPASLAGELLLRFHQAGINKAAIIGTMESGNTGISV